MISNNKKPMTSDLSESIRLELYRDAQEKKFKYQAYAFIGLCSLALWVAISKAQTMESLLTVLFSAVWVVFAVYRLFKLPAKHNSDDIKKAFSSIGRMAFVLWVCYLAIDTPTRNKERIASNTELALSNERNAARVFCNNKDRLVGAINCQSYEQDDTVQVLLTIRTDNQFLTPVANARSCDMMQNLRQAMNEENQLYRASFSLVIQDEKGKVLKLC